MRQNCEESSPILCAQAVFIDECTVFEELDTEKNQDDYMGFLATCAAEIHQFAAKRVANVDDAADIAQQALLQACTKLSSFRGPNLRAWLFSIARNLIIDHYRAQRRFQFVEVAQAALSGNEPALQTLPEVVLTLCEHRERVRRWVEGMTQRLRLEEQVAVLLADAYGYRDKDSATLMGMSLPSFKLLLHGARPRLHSVVGERRVVVRETSAFESEQTRCEGKGAQCPKALFGLGAARLIKLRDQLLEGLG